MDILNEYTLTELGVILIALLFLLPLFALLYAFVSKKVTTYLGRESKLVGQLWKKYIVVIIFSLIVERIIDFLLNLLWGTALETNIYLDYLDTGIINLFPLLLEIWLVNLFIFDKEENQFGLKLSASIVIANFIVLMGIFYGLSYGLESILSMLTENLIGA